MANTIKVLLWLHRTKTNKDGQTPWINIAVRLNNFWMSGITAPVAAHT